MELGLGVGLLLKWNDLLFIFMKNERIITYSMPGLNQRIFFVLRPVTLPQPCLGRIAEQVQVLVGFDILHQLLSFY